MKNAVKYNKLIKFWKADQISDGQGGTYPSYTFLFTDNANIIAKTEKRGLQQGQLVLVGYFHISIRFRQDIDIDKSMLIKSGNQYYTIHSIINDQDREYQLVCTTSDNNKEVFMIENPYENFK
ncbi:phage head closure protein [Pedobacter cryoconitis]|uniref:SPP1 family predicted phage head-tail adaptor n=1 Tax=Pedobacter cryoconitis TaxID=188932 RepID=A0A327SAN1_9SPHI|nr:phage head closure protein [Pedobacter cryoconitis]RAJ24994.1 SPP1 family predicted phage head-tail adaptor [Pedobacter cryoconitis]